MTEQNTEDIIDQILIYLSQNRTSFIYMNTAILKPYQIIISQSERSRIFQILLDDNLIESGNGNLPDDYYIKLSKNGRNLLDNWDGNEKLSIFKSYKSSIEKKEKKENYMDELKEKNLILSNESMEYKKIIRQLEEQLLITNLLKNYWYILVGCAIIGGIIVKIWQDN